MQTPELIHSSYVLTLEEIGNLAAEGGKAAETLMNVVALIGKRFKTEVCSAYLLEPDRANLVLAATLVKFSGWSAPIIRVADAGRIALQSTP